MRMHVVSPAWPKVTSTSGWVDKPIVGSQLTQRVLYIVEGVKMWLVLILDRLIGTISIIAKGMDTTVVQSNWMGNQYNLMPTRVSQSRGCRYSMTG